MLSIVISINDGEKEMPSENNTTKKKNRIGHVLRGDGLLRDVLEGKCLGRDSEVALK